MDLTSGLVVQFVASKWDTIKQNAKNWFRNEDTGNWKRNCHEDITLNGKTEACFQKKLCLRSISSSQTLSQSQIARERILNITLKTYPKQFTFSQFDTNFDRAECLQYVMHAKQSPAGFTCVKVATKLTKACSEFIG